MKTSALFLILLAALGCSQRRDPIPLDPVISKVLLEDTIHYNLLSFGVNLFNTGNDDLAIKFKRAQTTITQGSINSKADATIWIWDSKYNKRAELLLYPVYPGKIIVKKKSSVSLLFRCECKDITGGLKPANRNSYTRQLMDAIKSKKIILYFPNHTGNSIRVRLDPSFSIEKRGAMISDIKQNFK